MKRLLNRWWVPLTIVVLAGGAAGFAAQWGAAVAPWLIKSRFASELDPSNPQYQSVMCGPESLSVAVGRLGISVPTSEIASRCRVTSYGVAFTDLERSAAAIPGIEAASRKLDWESLQRIEGVALLFVKGNHFVAVDPRETSDTARGAVIRVYDRDVPARWYSRTDLESIWSGDALVITRSPETLDTSDAARGVWQECYIDKGVLPESAVARFRFSLRNAGSQPLQIEGVQKSCGCIHQKISTEQVPPQESAEIEVDVTLNGKEGFIQQYLIVKTNDPARPVSYLRMACGVPRKRPVSTKTIRLEDLPQGGTLRQELVVADPGFTGVRLNDALYRPGMGSPTPADLSCSVTWEKVETDSGEVSARTGFPTSPGDYVVRLLFQAEGACPVGPFEGTLEISVEADDAVTKHQVEIRGTVVQDVHSVPQIALITLGSDPGIAGRATIQLRSRADRQIVISKVRSDGPSSLELSWAPVGQHRYSVVALARELPAGSAPIQGTVHFELDSGAIVSVPVSVFRPPTRSSDTPEGAADGLPTTNR